MVRDAEAHAAEDVRHREEIELRNQADNAHYQAEKVLREQGSQLPEHVRADLASKSSAVKRALDASDVDGMRRAMAELQQAMLAVGQHAYAAHAASTASSDAASAGYATSATPGTVEGEYREV
jgi:molecular chaperone DnaK